MAGVRITSARAADLPRTATHFGLGAAPDQWDALTRAMTAKGYTKMELIDAGLAVAGKNGGIYDKFRARLMLPSSTCGGTWWASPAVSSPVLRAPST